MAGVVTVRLRSGGVRVIPAGRLRVNRVRRISASVSGRSQEPSPGAGLSFTDILKTAGKAALGFISGGPAGAITAVGGEIFGPSKPEMLPQPLVASTCPEGFRVNPQTGVCEKVGLIGGLERLLPGGATGTLPTVAGGGGGFGQAVIGAFGTPALVPMQAGTIQRLNGTTGAILRCPGGMVLGKDDLCYPKSVLGARGRFRKHPAARKPPVSVRDAQAIRQAESAKNRVKKLAQGVGFSVKKR